MDDTHLMARLKSGDEAAFKMLVDRHYANIFRLCHRYVQRQEDAEELAQDVFIRLYKAADSYEHRAKLTTYLYRIAVNLSLNRIRDRKRKRWTSLEFLRENAGQEPAGPARDNPEFQLELSEKQRIVRQAIDGLPENQRTAVILRRYNGMSYEEIAEVMRCSVSAVEARLHRAKLNLRKRLQKYVLS